MAILMLGIALAAVLAALALVERRRHVATRALVRARENADRLRDDIWRLEAAAADRDRAEAANEAKGRFLATVSHEIRTPLAGMIGTAELLAAMPLGDEAASYVRAMRTSGAALSSLIDEILDFSRIEAGRLELADVVFETTPLVESVVELLSPRAQDKGVAIAGLIEPNVPRTLRGDPARLRQVLLNLAGNAVKFTNTGGIGLRVARLGETGPVRFTVSDTGPGIAADRRDVVFEEFEQGDSSATRAHDGTGLGLAISRALAERMGGSLTLQTTSADGSVFALELPCHSDAVGWVPLRAERRVLLVAQTPFEAPFLAERLSGYGAHVVQVVSEDAALRALEDAAPFDVAVLDCALGEDVMRRLGEHARRRNVARIVVLLSPFERRALSPRAWGAIDGWLVKPVREASLQQFLVGRARVAPGVADAMASVPRLDGRHVLLAEDDDVNALVATRLLQRQGARVTRVHDGAAAVSTLALPESTVDVVLMDIRMPLLDGLAAARTIRDREQAEDLRPLPLLALSANAFADDRRTALAAGFDAFLVKPVGLEGLANAIHDAIHDAMHADERRSAA